MTHHPPIEPDPDTNAADDLIACARTAEDAVRRLAHLTLHAPDLAPADVDTVLSHLAETVAALPQVAGQLRVILDRACQIHPLAMDGMTQTTDPDLAIDTARHHLDQSRGPAVETYRHLNAARNEVAHIRITDAVDESEPNGLAVSQWRTRPEHREPPTHGRPDDLGRRSPGR